VFWFKRRLSTFSADTAGKLDVLGHDGYTLGVDSAQVGILEKSNQVGFARLLKGHDGRALETQIGLEVLGDLSHQALEGQFPDKELRALLVPSDFTQRHGAGPVSMRFLDTTSSWGALPRCLCGQLFPRRFTASRLTCSLLSSCHLEFRQCYDTKRTIAAIYVNASREGSDFIGPFTAPCKLFRCFL